YLATRGVQSAASRAASALILEKSGGEARTHCRRSAPPSACQRNLVSRSLTVCPRREPPARSAGDTSGIRQHTPPAPYSSSFTGTRQRVGGRADCPAAQHLAGFSRKERPPLLASAMSSAPECSARAPFSSRASASPGAGPRTYRNRLC